MLRIREIRRDKGISAAELAAAAGVNVVSIYRYEEGTREPSFNVMGKIAKTLGVKITELIADETDKSA